jgi:hypothetical protein
MGQTNVYGSQHKAQNRFSLTNQLCCDSTVRADAAEQGVDKALDSLITTAQKLNLTYNHSPKGSSQTRRA